jgi:hypothetical protein
LYASGLRPAGFFALAGVEDMGAGLLPSIPVKKCYFFILTIFPKI